MTFAERALPSNTSVPSPTGNATSPYAHGLWPYTQPGARRDLKYVDIQLLESDTTRRSGGNLTPPRFRATFTPSSRRRPDDDGTSTAYRTRTLRRRSSETPNLIAIDATQYECFREW